MFETTTDFLQCQEGSLLVSRINDLPLDWIGSFEVYFTQSASSLDLQFLTLGVKSLYLWDGSVVPHVWYTKISVHLSVQVNFFLLWYRNDTHTPQFFIFAVIISRPYPSNNCATKWSVFMQSLLPPYSLESAGPRVFMRTPQKTWYALSSQPTTDKIKWISFSLGSWYIFRSVFYYLHHGRPCELNE